MKINVKNMVCQRCIHVVENQLKEIGLHPTSIELGEVDFGNEQLSSTQQQEVKTCLEVFGFEVLDDKTSKLIEKAKLLILEFSRNTINSSKKTKLSDFLKNNLNVNYNYVSKAFSSIVGVTMEHYFIQLKIEKAKELIIYDELTLDKIADYLGYSSTAHLSTQFKKITGFTPSYFKEIKAVRKRIPLDKL